MAFYGPNPFMGQNISYSFKDNLRRFVTSKSALNQLILINLIVFLVEWIAEILLSITGFLFKLDPMFKEDCVARFMQFLACPASGSALLHRPWTIVTSLFFHLDFWHIFFNMLMLFVTGKIFLSYLSNRQMWITYFIGGICGNLLYIASFNYFPAFASVVDDSLALGASGSIMAIMAAITVYKPNHQLRLLLIGSVKLMWVTIIFLAIDLLSIPKENAGGHLAHLGGAIYGALSVLFYLKNINLFKKWFHRKPKKKKYATATNFSYSYRPVSDEEINAKKAETQKKIDAILDKISKNGYDSLSKEEKDFLFFESKK